MPRRSSRLSGNVKAFHSAAPSLPVFTPSPETCCRTKPKPGKTRRGQKSLKAKHFARVQAYNARVSGMDLEGLLSRCPEGNARGIITVPFCYSSNPASFTDVCPFYLEWHTRLACPDNPFIHILSGPNVANPDGSGSELGVGASVALAPSDSKPVCFYVGELYTRARSPPRGRYTLEVFPGCGTFIDAEYDTRDPAYHMFHPPTEYCRVPPNYGRYINTLGEADLAAGKHFNCRFAGCPCGHDCVAVFVTKPIAVNEELLIPYPLLS